MCGKRLFAFPFAVFGGERDDNDERKGTMLGMRKKAFGIYVVVAARDHNDETSRDAGTCVCVGSSHFPNFAFTPLLASKTRVSERKYERLSLKCELRMSTTRLQFWITGSKESHCSPWG